MLTEYKDFNKKFGLRNLQSFVTPKILDLNTIVIPYYSMLYIYNPNSKRYISNEHYFIKFTKKKFVYNVIGYNNPPYKVRNVKVNENALLRNISKEHPGLKLYKTDKFFKYLKDKPNDIKHTIPIINFNTVHEGSKYTATILEYYQMFKNSITTLINNIIDFDNKTKIKGKHDINHFIILEIPDTLYALPLLEKYSKYETPTTEMVKLFYDTSRLLLLELIKLLDDDISNTSVFHKLIETGKDKNVTLIMSKNDKGIFINLKDLYSFLKISDYDNSSKVNGNQLQKLFFFMLKSVLLLPGFTPEDIDDNKYADKIALGIKKIEEIETDDIVEDINEKDIIKHVEKSLSEEDANVIDIIENEEEETTVVSYKGKYDKIESLDKIEDDIEKETLAMLDTLAENKQLPKPKYKKLIEVIKTGLNQPSPYKDGKKIKDLINITKEDLEIKDEDVKIPVTKSLYNKEDAKDTIGAIDKKYIKNVYKKDMISTIVNINKAGLIVKDIQREVGGDILGEYEEYTISVNDMGKSSYDLKVRLPIVHEDGTYTISGNTYVLKTQKSDKPIKKIDFNRVSLTSAFGKLFVDRSPMKKLDRGFALKKQILKLAESGKVKNFVSGTIKLVETKVPQDYSELSRYIKSFKFGNFMFSFSYYKRADIIGNEKLEDIEKDKYVVCGKYNNDVIVMDEDGVINIYRKGKYDKLSTVTDLLELDNSKLKDEFSMVKVHKKYIPVAILLSYYMGLYNLLKLLKVEYEVLEGGRVRVNEPDVIVLRFKFNTVVIKKSTPTNNLILSGFSYEDKVLKKVDIDVFNNKDLFKTVFNEMELPLSSVTEIELYENMFVDPVTASVLKDMNEPTTFIGLMVRSSEMLLDDFYNHPNSMKGYTMKGYERIPQFVYKTMIASIKKKKNEEFFGRSRLVMDPYGTWRILNEDSAAALIEDLNPVALLKQHEDSTYLGTGSRSKESLGVASRELHKDDIGIISESSKDSGDVGITAYMSANPVIGNLRGIKKENIDKLIPSNILSTSSMLAPFSMFDDPKRSTRV